ncbi:hypothetical protein BGI41_05745 [Methanobrevibacter sp. 87.7]|uniref:hypothetical protein n=1 Tax=Methanobrevibacter sp. 87.7 TaxID=387957 RepID=UPI000B50C60B|nr:hypothetical protein [Methanobrevibacter sp. 87.7]OWT32800.1 hypothetical protein BGI41_05745 [Methanobrevibacter sp. 87.7]
MNSNEKKIIEKAEKIISNMKGTLKVEKLSNKEILDLIDIESKIDINIVPIINEGMKECFRQDVTFVIFKKGYFRRPPSPTLILVGHNGEIIGHEIFTDEERDEYKNDDNAFLLSEDFVIFKDKNQYNNRYLSEKSFVLPPVAFPELENIEGIKKVVSSSPSTHSDEYLKKNYGYDPKDRSIASILVSISLEKTD